jgi:DNA polymerase/3'-5' exonuclease PolX
MVAGGKASAMAQRHHVALIRGAARTVKKMFPQIKSLYLVGASIRGKVGTDIDFVAEVPAVTPQQRKIVQKLERDQVINIPLMLPVPGRKQKVRVETDIFFAYPTNLKTTVLHYGLGKDIIRWKTRARSRGYKLNRYGLWKGKKRITGSPARIAQILGTDLKPFINATLDHPL